MTGWKMSHRESRSGLLSANPTFKPVEVFGEQRVSAGRRLLVFGRDGLSKFGQVIIKLLFLQMTILGVNLVQSFELPIADERLNVVDGKPQRSECRFPEGTQVRAMIRHVGFNLGDTGKESVPPVSSALAPSQAHSGRGGYDAAQGGRQKRNVLCGLHVLVFSVAICSAASRDSGSWNGAMAGCFESRYTLTNETPLLNHHLSTKSGQGQSLANCVSSRFAIQIAYR